MARKKNRRNWTLRIAGLAILAGGGAAAWLWWDIQHWTPAEADYPDQGAVISQASGLVNFNTLEALGASFVYLEASIGSDRIDARFADNITAAKDAGLDVGAIHIFDPCTLADGQTANFVTVVPRTADMLPPVIALDQTAQNCPKKVSDAAVESELMTLINQIENHSGKPAILKIEPEFEAPYAISARFERNLWVNRTRFAPTYAQRPWLLWSANNNLHNEAAEEPVEWVVVQP